MVERVGATRDRTSRNGESQRSKGPAPAEREPAREASAGKVATARDRIVRSVMTPFNAVLITRRSIEEVLDDAVRRGRMTRADAQDMIQSIFSKGARVTDELLSDVERLLGRTALEEADAPKGAAAEELPITAYDELSAAQVQQRLDPLTPAQLRRVRSYEQRNANRKTVLERIDRQLR